MTPEQCRRELRKIDSGRVIGTERDLIGRVAAVARAPDGAVPPSAANRLTERCREIERLNDPLAGADQQAGDGALATMPFS